MIAVAMERHFDRDLVQGAVKRLRIEITRPLSRSADISAPRPAFSAGSCAEPPRMANSSETSGTACEGTSQNFNPRGLVTTSTLTAE